MVVAEALTCFKAYDVRGKLGSELNEDIAYRIGRTYAQYLNAKCVVVGVMCAPDQRTPKAGASQRRNGRRRRCDQRRHQPSTLH